MDSTDILTRFFIAVDIDECADSSKHSCFAAANVVCRNTLGNYACDCKDNDHVAIDSGGRNCQRK